MQRSPCFYTVNVDQFLLQSKKSSRKMRAWLALVKDNMWPQNTAYLEHTVSLSTKYEYLYNETYIKLLLNINAIHPLLYFSLNFLPSFLLS